MYKLKEEDQATLYSPAEEWVLLAASTKEPEEREFVVDSGASMHVVSKRDRNSAELVRRRWWRPTARYKPEKKRRKMSSNWTYLSKLCFMKKLSQFFLSREALWGSWVHLPLDQLSATTYHQQRQENWRQKNPTVYLVYQRVLLQLHFHLIPIFITWFRIWCQQIHRKSWRASGRLAAWIHRNRKPQQTWRIRRSLQEFRENLVDESTSTEPWRNPEQGSPRAELGSGKHSVHTHFPKDPNCDICLKTKITRASCRRRAGTVVPRAEHFGDLITADHKVLGEESESRNNHRLPWWSKTRQNNWYNHTRATQKTSQETQKSPMKFLEPTRKPKVIYTDKSPEFGKVCEDLCWNHSTSTPHRSETNGIAERAVRRDERWVDFMDWYCHLRNIQDLLSDGTTPYERRLGAPCEGPVIPFGAVVEYHHTSVKDLSRLHQFG